MDFYFFRPIDKAFAPSFYEFSIKQNRRIARFMSLVITSLCVILFLSQIWVDYDRIVNNKWEFKIVDYSILTLSLLYFIVFTIGKRKIKKTRIHRLLSTSYAVVIILGAMALSFTAQHNPRNTMTFFLMGLLAVAMLWIFSARETIIVCLISAAVFFTGVHLFHASYARLGENYIAGVLAFTLFFCISRILFSYHYNYFLQLKTVESKNNEIGKINKIQHEMLGVVAHDLRSPFNNIAALVDLAKNYPTTADERNEYYDMILTACEEADHIINDLIDVARKGESELHTAYISINHFLEQVAYQWQHRMTGGKQLILKGPGKEIFTHIQPQKMQRVLDNLINNAIKFTQKDGTICMEFKEADQKIRISIWDDGIGIPDHLQAQVFDRFSKAGRRGLEGEKSYGLGLSICKQIVEQHKGQLSMESKEGEGTIFHIDLKIP